MRANCRSDARHDVEKDEVWCGCLRYLLSDLLYASVTHNADFISETSVVSKIMWH